jgi:hypothetical protein
VPPERLGQYLRDFKNLCERYGYAYTVFGHFGDGCIHARMTFGLRTAEGVAKFRAYMEEAAELCLAHGGSLSGEHGDGQAKGELLPKMYGPELIQAFREFKSIWDPHWRMNPGKIVDAQPLDTSLRLGPEYRPRPVETHFKFPNDRGSFAIAAERCFGVGKCRALGGQVMCPSFQATREEMHSTRGRAHLLPSSTGFAGTAASVTGRGRRSFSGPTPSTTIFFPARPRQPWRFSRMQAIASWFRPRDYAAAARSMITACLALRGASSTR